MKCPVWLAVVILVVSPAAAIADRIVLQTDGGAEREAAVQALSGKPSGITVTAEHP
jgi:hypothetical protein